MNPTHALRQAVIHRDPAQVRAQMRAGANAREGVYPHRDATSPLTLAIERNYTEIAEIIEQEEQSATGTRTAPGALFQQIGSGNTKTAIELLSATPDLITTRHPNNRWTPLHAALRMLDLELATWLLGHGAPPSARDTKNQTPLDAAAHSLTPPHIELFTQLATRLRSQGAPMTAAIAVALGDTGWLRTQHAQGTLENTILDNGGLLSIAVRLDRPEILELLLDLGLDPNERIPHSQGMPLWHCAGSGKHRMARLLLERGADPNASVHASGDPVFQAYAVRDQQMIDLLASFGGIPAASTAGLYRLTALGRKFLAGEAPCRLERAHGLAEELLWGAACGGDPELTRLALERIDWPRDDPRWFPLLEQPLRVWNHGGHNTDRSTYPVCLRRIAERCDPNIRGRMEESGFGLTILHGVAGARPSVLPHERAAFASILLEAGARLDIRDHLLESTPLGWACRWGRLELVELFLQHGADPLEPDAPAWATPEAWARRFGHHEILTRLQAAREERA